MNLFSVGGPEFSSSRLTLARMRRGMKQEELAHITGLNKTLISKYENGERTPDASQVVQLADQLRFPITFFYQSEVGPIGYEGISFRARRSEVKAVTRDRTVGSLVMASKIFDTSVSKQFHLPPPDLPNIPTTNEVSSQLIAEQLRVEWKLGPYPIPNMVHLLEAKGIRVYWFNEYDPSVDAVSKVEGSIPFALLSQRPRGGERMRFDLAHELGHLVMHRGQRELFMKKVEDEANNFAAAFLMPEEQFRKECPKMPSLTTLLNLKARWGVSLQALIYRCMSLKLLTESQYKSAFRKISVNGWRVREPGELPCEESKVWEQILNYLNQSDVSVENFANKMHVHTDEFFNLVPLARKQTLNLTPRLEDHFLNLHELGYNGPTSSESPLWD